MIIVIVLYTHNISAVIVVAQLTFVKAGEDVLHDHVPQDWNVKHFNSLLQNLAGGLNVGPVPEVMGDNMIVYMHICMPMHIFSQRKWIVYISACLCICCFHSKSHTRTSYRLHVYIPTCTCSVCTELHVSVVHESMMKICLVAVFLCVFGGHGMAQG